MDVKQVIVIRKDLNMRKGKIAAQAAHVSMLVLLNMMDKYHADEIDQTVLKLVIEDGSSLAKWLLTGTFKKIVVSVNSEEELLDIYQKALDNNFPAALITDSGLTEFNGVPTKTCIAIGPGISERLDKITGHLSLL